MIRYSIAIVASIAMLSLAPSAAVAQDALPNVTALFKAQKASVVSIQTTINQSMPFVGTVPGMGQGSGFVVDSDGYVLTNNHVVDGATSIRVTIDSGESFEAELVGADPKTDIALVKVSAGRPLRAVTLGDSEHVEVGQWVVAIGNPFGLDYSVTAGIVSAKGRNIGAGPYDDFIQTDASINPGNSGGPLFDMGGRVIGVNTAIVKDGAGIGFSVPVDLVKILLPQLKQRGYVVRGFIGTGIQDLTDELAESFGVPRSHGVLIGSIDDRGPAAAAGLRAGDIVTNFGGVRVRSTQELLREVAKATPAKRASVRYVRDNHEFDAQLVVAERPDAVRPRGAAKPIPPKPNTRSGVKLRPVDQRIARALGMSRITGVLVEGVVPSSAAAKALRAGDVILQARGEEVNSPADFDAIAATIKPKQVLRLIVFRDGRTQFVGLRL